MRLSKKSLETILCIFFSLAGLASGSDIHREDYLDQMVMSICRKTERDANGAIKKISTTKSGRVTVKLNISETQERDGKGVMQTKGISCVTTLEHSSGDKIEISEASSGGYSDLEVTRVEKVVKTLKGSISTVETKDEHGILRIIQRITVESAEGTQTVITESLGGDGVLSETSRKVSYNE